MNKDEINDALSIQHTDICGSVEKTYALKPMQFRVSSFNLSLLVFAGLFCLGGIVFCILKYNWLGLIFVGIISVIFIGNAAAILNRPAVSVQEDGMTLPRWTFARRPVFLFLYPGTVFIRWRGIQETGRIRLKSLLLYTGQDNKLEIYLYYFSENERQRFFRFVDTVINSSQ